MKQRHGSCVQRLRDCETYTAHGKYKLRSSVAGTGSCRIPSKTYRNWCNTHSGNSSEIWRIWQKLRTSRTDRAVGSTKLRSDSKRCGECAATRHWVVSGELSHSLLPAHPLIPGSLSPSTREVRFSFFSLHFLHCFRGFSFLCFLFVICSCYFYICVFDFGVFLHLVFFISGVFFFFFSERRFVFSFWRFFFFFLFGVFFFFFSFWLFFWAFFLFGCFFFSFLCVFPFWCFFC